MIDNGLKFKNCFKCDIGYTRKHMVNGQGAIDADIMIIGEAPGYYEDKTGIPFVGKSGLKLRSILNKSGFITFNVYITNIIKCKPPNNRNPKPLEINNCSSHLEIELRKIKPKLVILLGKIAIEYFFPNYKDIPISKLNKKAIRTKKGTYIVLNYHPAFIVRNDSLYEEAYKEDFIKYYKLYTKFINKHYELEKSLNFK